MKNIDQAELNVIDAAYQSTRKWAKTGKVQDYRTALRNFYGLSAVAAIYDSGGPEVGGITPSEWAEITKVFAAAYQIDEPSKFVPAVDACATALWKAISTEEPVPEPVIPSPPIPSDDLPINYEFRQDMGWRRTDVGGFGWRQSSHPLIDMLRDAETDYKRDGRIPSIGVYGYMHGNGQQLGGGDSDSKAYTAHWKGTPMVAEIHGMDEGYINAIYFRTHLNNGNYGGGIRRVRVHNVRIQPSMNQEQRALGGMHGDSHLHEGVWGRCELFDVTIVKNPALNDFYGGLKWGVRMSARMSFHARNVVGKDHIQEHLFYNDSPQPGPDGFAFVAESCIQRGNTTRTHTQIVNRAIDNPGPSGNGIVLLRGCIHEDHGGDGGAAFTVAGHLGPIFIDGCSANTSMATIAIWRDNGPAKGVYEDELGRVNGDVVIRGSLARTRKSNDYGGANDRDAISVSSARSVHIIDWDIETTRTAIKLKNGPGDNPKESCEPVILERTDGLRNSEGIWKLNGPGARKVRWGENEAGHAVILNDDQIDALAPVGAGER